MSHTDPQVDKLPQDYDNPNSNDLVFFHSPLSLMAQFVLLMQSRFEQIPQWQYTDNEEQTGIFITTEYNVPSQVSDETPAIVVGRGTSVWEDTVLGNTDRGNSQRMKTGAEFQWSHVTMDIQYRVLSEKLGECEILGDIVQSTVATGKKIIKKNLKLQDISAVTLQPVRPYDGDYYDFNSTVQFRLIIGQRWLRQPTAPVLKRIQTDFGYDWDDVRTVISTETGIT